MALDFHAFCVKLINGHNTFSGMYQLDLLIVLIANRRRAERTGYVACDKRFRRKP